MNCRGLNIVVAAMSVWCATSARGAEPADSVQATPQKGFVARIVDYFSEANVEHPERPLDISFIGGPHYSSESGFGLGVVGSGAYYSHRGPDGMPDGATPSSNVSLKLDITTGQLYKIGAEGYHICRNDDYRLNYDIYFYSFKDKFWGIGYYNNVNDASETTYTRLQSNVKADFVFKVRDNVFVGPLSQFTYVNATKVRSDRLFDGEAMRTFTTGLGITFILDSRDVPTNAYSGVMVRFDQLFNPRFLANKYAFCRSELTAAAYTRVWKDGVLASMAHVDLTYGNTPWGMLPTFGGSSNMRGYYEGRYRDKCEMDFTVELRQRVWRRNGFVVWAGAGTVFPKFSAFKWTHVLPNFGVGYRWEFKHRVNVRLDVGVGRHEKGINFSINEAF